MSVLGELKRRKMFQVAVVYLVVAWLIMQIVDVIHTPLRLPEWFPTVVIVFLAIGFPIAMIISWAFNVTPGGLVRDAGGEESAKGSGRTIEFVLIGLVAVAVLWLIYRTEFDEPPTEQPVAQEVAPDILPNSVAVLPFANLSPDPDNAFFAAGIHDTILNELAKIKDMTVISRTAMLRYADGTTPIPQIAEELRVETVMEGSVQYANGRVLVTAQLIDPTTNAHLWSENYDREFADIFAIQADIATQIAVAMRTQLSADERLSIAKQMTSSPEAYALYLRAMELADWDFSPGDSTAEFHGLLDDAIELDPAFARAHAAKANAYSFQRGSQALAKESAETALSLDPNLGSAYSALAKVHARAMHNAEALDAFDTALRLSPNDIDILDDFSLPDPSVDGVAVDEVECLGKVRLHFHLAGADGGAGGTAEGGEEVVRGVAVGDLDGAGTLGESLVFFRGVGDLRNAVEQHLGADAAYHGFGKVAGVSLVGDVRPGGKLVSAGGADVADELLEIVVVGNEFLREGIQ
jgi:TolB-like protein